MYTFLKGCYIVKALPSKTNPKNWGGFINFKKYCIATVTKLVLAAWKSVIVVTIDFTKFSKILIVKIKSNFDGRPNFTIKVNSENQWLYHYCISIHQILYKIINNIVANICLENEEMHPTITLVCKKWNRHIINEFLKK